jgi:hypothetical protein
MTPFQKKVKELERIRDLAKGLIISEHVKNMVKVLAVAEGIRRGMG